MPACNKSNGRFCVQCKSARYCSAACQEADWPTHKLLCAAFSEFDASSRPATDRILAFLFLVDEHRPKVIWLQCTWRGDEDGRFQHPKATLFLGTGAPKHAPIQHNAVLKRDLSDTIYNCHRETFLIDGSMTNRRVAAITSAKPELYHDWRGPIIAYGMKGLGIDQTRCRDITLIDLRHIADFFLTYGYEPAQTCSSQSAQRSMASGSIVSATRKFAINRASNLLR